MGKSKGNVATGPKPEAKKEQPSPKGGRKSRADLVDKAIQAFEKKLNTKNLTVGDFVRLLQLQKEMDGDEPKDIEVTWVELGETESFEK